MARYLITSTLNYKELLILWQILIGLSSVKYEIGQQMEAVRNPFRYRSGRRQLARDPRDGGTLNGRFGVVSISPYI